jgi:FMN-dependent NADH-azoreductase
MNILQINSSVRGAASESSRVAANIVAKLSAANPSANVTVRDLGARPHPVLVRCHCPRRRHLPLHRSRSGRPAQR